VIAILAIPRTTHTDWKTDVTLEALSQPGLTAGNVESGDTITVSASGTWCMGGTGATAECGGPEGIRSARPDEADVLLQRASMGMLVGRIGEGEWFEIGAGRTFVATSSGPLTLVFNDRVCCYGDNSGQIVVIVDVKVGR
jgi:hypothetical protein